MDFELSFFEALSPGESPESYASCLAKIDIEDRTWIHPKLGAVIRGYTEIEGKQRLLQGSIKNRRVFDLELSEFEPNDTLLGIPLKLRAIPFHKALHAQGIPAHIDEEKISLDNAPIEIYYEKGKLSSIVWTAFPTTQGTP
ncbi:hypothetical protein WG915_07395 [Corynebacterium sp. H128]|uniref:hypothetical protein n=1 Tax=Corynebacterium sp. H128 TaxID=3133427 RepID=UPI0030AA9206